MSELNVYTDGEEYVIAKDEADARMVYEAHGSALPDDVAIEQCDPLQQFTIHQGENDKDTETKTFGEWAERGRGYLCVSLP